MGCVHIYCGDGKGKTSAAVGLAVRAAGRGKKIAVARFLKTDDSGEVEGLKAIPQITVLPCERVFGFVSAMDEQTRKEAAAYNLELFEKAVSLAKTADMVILDEIMAAIAYGMVPEKRVEEFFKDRPEALEVVMTGRNPSGLLLSMADYVSEVKKVKHPYDRGIPARKEIEY